MKTNVEIIDEAIAKKLREAEAAGTTPNFTQEESERVRILIQDALSHDAKTSSETPVAVVRAGNAAIPKREPGEVGTVLRLRDILGTESFGDFAKRARDEEHTHKRS